MDTSSTTNPAQTAALDEILKLLKVYQSSETDQKSSAIEDLTGREEILSSDEIITLSTDFHNTIKLLSEYTDSIKGGFTKSHQVQFHKYAEDM